MTVKSICILRLSAIGDVCHAAAMVERIRQFAPDIEITWVIGKIEYQLVKGISGVNFVIFDKSKGVSAYSDLRRQLKGKSFDVLLAMQVALRANLVAACIRAKYKYGFDWDRSKELHWLFTGKRISAQHHPHVLDGFMAFADAIGVPKLDKPSWNIPIQEEVEIWADQITTGLDNYVVIAPAASKPERNWLAARYAELIDNLASQGLQIVLCGGPGEVDRQLGEKIEHITRRVSKNLIGQTNLKQLLAILRRARVVIAPDTGPAHMATTVGTDVVGLYAHSNPLRTGPYNNLDDVVSVYDKAVRQQYSKEWQHLPWGTRAKGKNLMAGIETKAVLTKVEAVLARQGE